MIEENEIEKELEKLVEKGLVEKLPDGNLRLTEKGTLQVENTILPSLGMTENLLKTESDLAEALRRLKKNDERNKVRMLWS